MGSAAWVTISLIVLAAGVVFVVDPRRLGTRWLSYTAYLNAAPWKRPERPSTAAVAPRRRALGGAFILFGLVDLVLALVSLR